MNTVQPAQFSGRQVGFQSLAKGIAGLFAVWASLAPVPETSRYAIPRHKTYPPKKFLGWADQTAPLFHGSPIPDLTYIEAQPDLELTRRSV